MYDSGEVFQGLEEEWNFGGANGVEWIAGVVVFLILAAVGGNPAKMLPLMLIGWLTTTFSLAALRRSFPDEVRGVRNALSAALGVEPIGIPAPARMQPVWSNAPLTELPENKEFRKLGFNQIFPSHERDLTYPIELQDLQDGKIVEMAPESGRPNRSDQNSSSSADGAPPIGFKIDPKNREYDLPDGRADRDSIRVWERYRDASFFWRFLALIQLPLIFAGILSMLMMYFWADTIVEIPEKPQPGHYSVRKLPDSEFINVANEIANLSSTYTPATAERQFKAARKLMWEPALSQFENEKVKREIPQIVETARSQIFIVDQNQLKVERRPERDFVVVRLPGVRQRMIGSQLLPRTQMVIFVRMTTIPKNIYNEYGIVVTDLRVDERELATYEVGPSDSKPPVVAPVNSERGPEVAPASESESIGQSSNSASPETRLGIPPTGGVPVETDDPSEGSAAAGNVQNDQQNQELGSQVEQSEESTGSNNEER